MSRSIRQENRAPPSVGCRLGRCAFMVLLGNPYPLATAILLSYLLVQVVLGIRGHSIGSGWFLQDVITYTVCLGVMGLLFALAVGHVLVTLSAGWRSRR